MRSGALAVGFLLALSAGFFGRAALTGRTLNYDDILFWFYPWKAMLYRMATEGRVGLWLPWEFSGMPHVADIQRQIFYPPNTIFYILPTGLAMVLFVGFHFAAAAILMYLFLRSMGPFVDAPREEAEATLRRVGQLGAVCGGIVFAWAAFPVLHLSQLPMLASYVWVPAVLLCLERWWRTPSWTWLGLGTLAFSLMVLGGSPQIVYITSVLAAVYALYLSFGVWRAEGLHAVLHRVPGLAIVPFLGLLLSALQLVPMAELATYTTRQTVVPSAYTQIGTASPRMLATFLTPYAFGNPQEGVFSGGDYTFHEECFYVGGVTLVLAAAALGGLWWGSARAWFFLVVAVVGVLIALGNNVWSVPDPATGEAWGPHDLMRRILPMFSSFRVPPRWMIWTEFGMAVLAALGIEALARYRAAHVRRTLHGMSPLLAALAAAAVLGLTLYVLVQRQVIAMFEGGLPLAVLAIAVLALAATRFWPRPALVTLIALVAFELLVFAARYVTLSPTADVTKPFDVLRQLADVPPPFRIMSQPSASTPTEVATWCPPFEVANVQGTNPLFLRPYVEFIYYSQAGGLPPTDSQTGMMHHNGFFVMGPHMNNPMSRMLNLRYALKLPPVLPAKGKVDPRTLVVNEVDGSFPWANVVRDFEVIPDRNAMLARMYDKKFDATKRVFFSRDPGASLGPAGSGKPRVSVLTYQADEVAVEVDTPHDAFVAFSEVFYPGWRAFVDDRETPVLRANDVFRAVLVPKGKHRLVMRFDPGTLRFGLGVTLLTTVLLVGITVWQARRRRTSERTGGHK